MSIMNLYSAIMDTLATSGIAAGVEGNAMFVADAAAFAGTEGASADALAGFFAEAGESYPSTFAGSIYEQPWYSMALDMASSTAKKQLIKFALNQAFGAATGSGGDAGGHMQVSYMGADDGGLLASLAGIMSSMQGRGNFNVNPFSARDGLDYVPYDNFPIRAHKGEAVLNKQDATEWRQSNTMDIPQPVQINLVVDGAELAEILFNISKRGVAVVHERGIGK